MRIWLNIEHKSHWKEEGESDREDERERVLLFFCDLKKNEIFLRQGFSNCIFDNPSHRWVASSLKRHINAREGERGQGKKVVVVVVVEGMEGFVSYGGFLCRMEKKKQIKSN